MDGGLGRRHVRRPSLSASTEWSSLLISLGVPRVWPGLRLMLTSVVVLCVGLIGATAAQAAVTQSSITSPSDPFYGFNQGQTQSVTISGTSNGTSSDTVDIRCYNDDGSSGISAGAVATGVAVSSVGSFSTSVLLSALEQGSSLCRLRAVPGGTTPTTGLSAFAGPRTALGYLTRATVNGRLYDFYVYDAQLAAADDYDSYSSCTLNDSYLMDPTVFGQQDSTGFVCNDLPNNPAQSDPTRSGIEVDGHPAYGTGVANHINGNAAGLPSLTIDSITQDPTTGDLTIKHTEPIVRCSGDPYPVTLSGCTTFIPSGVQVQQTVTQTDNGHMVSMRDVYSSTDGASHAVNLLSQNTQSFDVSGNIGTHVSYEFPGQSSFAPGTAGETVSVPANAPASILVENNVNPDGSTSGGRGAITYDQLPSGPFAFALGANGDGVFDVPNTLTVPAIGSVSLGYTYSTEFTLAAVRHDALVAQDGGQPPSISISSPAPNATIGLTPVTVTGSASAGSGVQGVTVNGVPATLSGGSYTASVPLTPGRNTLTAIVTSDLGNTATTAETVTYGPVAIAKSAPCPRPSGQLTGAKLGPVHLGVTRQHVRRILPHFGIRNYYTDNFCLAPGFGIRVGYASARLLGPTAKLARTTRRVVLALTANSFYSVAGVRPGMRLATAAQQLRLGKVIHLGPNYWYVIPAGNAANDVLKIRHGVVQEVGVANEHLTTNRTAQLRLLANF